MHLIRLIYASKATSKLDRDVVENILSSSRKNNKEAGLTGILFHNNEYFLQCLEGSRVNVNQVYHRILGDTRHCEPAIIQYEEISQRDFTGWSMGYIPPKKISGSLISQFSGDEVFKPFSMSGESCYQLLLELKKLGVDNL